MRRRSDELEMQNLPLRMDLKMLRSCFEERSGPTVQLRWQGDELERKVEPKSMAETPGDFHTAAAAKLGRWADIGPEAGLAAEFARTSEVGINSSRNAAHQYVHACENGAFAF